MRRPSFDGNYIYKEINKLKEEVRDLELAVDELDGGNTYARSILTSAKVEKQRELDKKLRTRYELPEEVKLPTEAHRDDVPYGTV